jgi:hypothetical protein
LEVVDEAEQADRRLALCQGLQPCGRIGADDAQLDAPRREQSQVEVMERMLAGVAAIVRLAKGGL